jgi:hypothetical protein
VDKTQVVEQCPDGVTSLRYCQSTALNVTIKTKGESGAPLVESLYSDASYSWDSCGTKLDRLQTSKVSVTGSLSAGSKVTVSASGATDLHAPLTSGAWQVRIYEDGEAKETHTEVGDLMQALKFDDPKNTTFTMTVSFTLPKKEASGKFNANVVAVDQAKADYLCLDVKYAYSAELATLVEDTPYCIHQEDTEDHKCFEACADSKFAMKGISTSGSCPSNYNTVDKTQVVEQCPDGVTSLRYCQSTALNVTIKTKGESGIVIPFGEYPIMRSNAECTKDSDCPSSYCQNGFCHGCFDKCCETDSDCTKKGMTYCQNDSTKTPPYFCHA